MHLARDRARRAGAAGPRRGARARRHPRRRPPRPRGRRAPAAGRPLRHIGVGASARHRRDQRLRRDRQGAPPRAEGRRRRRRAPGRARCQRARRGSTRGLRLRRLDHRPDDAGGQRAGRDRLGAGRRGPHRGRDAPLLGARPRDRTRAACGRAGHAARRRWRRQRSRGRRDPRLLDGLPPAAGDEGAEGGRPFGSGGGALEPEAQSRWTAIAWWRRAGSRATAR